MPTSVAVLGQASILLTGVPLCLLHLFMVNIGLCQLSHLCKPSCIKLYEPLLLLVLAFASHESFRMSGGSLITLPYNNSNVESQ